MQNKIKLMRKEKKITQEELAKLTNTSRQTIISIEKGKYDPSIWLAYKISKVFDKLIEEIFIFEEIDNNEK